jgi:hypothetical protein
MSKARPVGTLHISAITMCLANRYRFFFPPDFCTLAFQRAIGRGPRVQDGFFLVDFDGEISQRTCGFWIWDECWEYGGGCGGHGVRRSRLRVRTMLFEGCALIEDIGAEKGSKIIKLRIGNSRRMMLSMYLSRRYLANFNSDP